jgi:hypothetical protein
MPDIVDTDGPDHGWEKMGQEKTLDKRGVF